MRIVHVVKDVRESGNGIVNNTVDLACEQARQGHDVVVLSRGGAFEPLLRSHGVVHVSSGAPETRLHGAAAGLAALWRLCKAMRPDAIHAHNLEGAVQGWLVRRASRAAALICTAHLERKRGIRIMTAADRLIVFTEDARQRLGAPSSAVVVPQGALGGVRLKAASAESAPKMDQPSIVTVCGLYRHKGVFDLLDAFQLVLQRVPNCHLYVVGHGPEAENLREAIRANDLQGQVHLEGFRPRPRDYIAGATVFVLASRSEPAGLVLAEARDAGAAIVGTTADGIPRMLDDGDAGMLVPPADPPAMAVALVDLLEDVDLRCAYRQRSAQNLDWLRMERYASDVLRVYSAATTPLGRGRPPRGRSSVSAGEG